MTAQPFKTIEEIISFLKSPYSADEHPPFRVAPQWMKDEAFLSRLTAAEKEKAELIERLRRLQIRLASLPAVYKQNPNDSNWYMTDFTKEQLFKNIEAMQSDIEKLLEGK